MSGEEPGQLVVGGPQVYTICLPAAYRSINILYASPYPYRTRLRSLRGYIAYRWIAGGTQAPQFTATPVERMTSGQYDFALLAEGDEMSFVFMALGTGLLYPTDAFQAACATEDGLAILSYQSDALVGPPDAVGFDPLH